MDIDNLLESSLDEERKKIFEETLGPSTSLDTKSSLKEQEDSPRTADEENRKRKREDLSLDYSIPKNKYDRYNSRRDNHERSSRDYKRDRDYSSRDRKYDDRHSHRHSNDSRDHNHSHSHSRNHYDDRNKRFKYENRTDTGDFINIDEENQKVRPKQNNELVLFGESMLPLDLWKNITRFNGSEEEASNTYTQYQNDFNRFQCKRVFDHHKVETWFREKYEPQYLLNEYKRKSNNARNQISKHFNVSSWDFINLLSQISLKSTNKPTKSISNVSETQINGESIDSTTSTSTIVTEMNHENAKENPYTLFIRSLPLNVSREDIISFFSKAGKVVCLRISDPRRTNSIKRYGWVSFETEQQARTALESLNNQELVASNPPPNAHYSTTSIRISLAPHSSKSFNGRFPNSNDKSTESHIEEELVSHPLRIAADLELALKLCCQLDYENQIPSEKFTNENQPDPVEYNDYLFLPISNEWKVSDKHWLLNDDSISGYNDADTTQKLDLAIYYLRKVHNYCFYCAHEFKNSEELEYKCKNMHYRSTPSNEQIEEWNKDSTSLVTSPSISITRQILESRLNENANDPYSQTAIKDLREKYLEFFNSKHVEIEPEKYMCVLCEKLFRGQQFVKKHLKNRHTDALIAIRDPTIDNIYFENYFKDPEKLVFVPERRYGGRFQKRGRFSHGGRRGGNFKSFAPPPAEDFGDEPRLKEHKRDTYVDLDNPTDGGGLDSIDYDNFFD